MGFPTEIFTDPVDETFICGICLGVMNNAASLSTCGHTFCGDCIADAVAKAPRCPICRRDTVQSHFYIPNFAVNELVSKMTIRCTNCDISREADDEAKPRAAKRSRTGRGDHGDVDDADEENCESQGAEVDCGGCNWKGKVSEWQIHIRNACKYEKIACTTPGCQHRCARKDLKAHLDDPASLERHIELRVEAKMNTKVEAMVASKMEILQRYFTAQHVALKQEMTSKLDALRDQVDPPSRIVVSNAGSEEVNGTYNRDKPTNLSSYSVFTTSCSYSRHEQLPSGEVRKYVIQRNRTRQSQAFWFISIPDETQPGTDRDTDFYFAKVNTKIPPNHSWGVTSHARLEVPHLEYIYE